MSGVTMSHRITDLRSDPETRNAGVKWKPEEEEELMASVRTNRDGDMERRSLSLKEAAHKWKRTEGGVKSRVVLLLCKLVDKGVYPSDDDASDDVSFVTRADLSRHREKAVDIRKERSKSSSSFAGNTSRRSKDDAGSFVSELGRRIDDLIAEVERLKNVVAML